MSMPGVIPSIPTAAQAAMQSGLASANEDTALTSGLSSPQRIPVGANDPFARTTEDTARAQAMVEAWQAYRGQLPDPLKVPRNQVNDNVKTNRIAPMVDKGVSWLFGKPVTIRITQNSGTQSESATGQGATEADPQTARAQDWLDTCLKANHFYLLMQKFAANGAICGMPFLLMHPDRPLANPQGMDYPRLTLLDPATVCVQTAPDDVDLVERYIIEYRIVAGSATGWRRKIIERVDPDGLASKSVTGYDRDDTWHITDYLRATDSAFWTPTGQSIWPYPFPPILHNQNLPNPNEFWGAPDVTPDIIALNKALNFTQSNIARILKYHAHPKTWAKGVRASELDMSVDNIITLPNVQSEIGNLEMHSDLKSSMDFASDLRVSMDELSRVPSVALGRLVDLPRGAISGATIRMLLEALIEKTEAKRLLYGHLVEELCQRLLWIGGFGQGIEVTLHWIDLLPVDDQLAAQAALAYSQVGVPQKMIWQYLGFDPDALADMQADEQQAQVTAFSRGQGLPPANPAQPALPPAAPASQSQQQPDQPADAQD